MEQANWSLTKQEMYISFEDFFFSLVYACQCCHTELPLPILLALNPYLLNCYQSLFQMVLASYQSQIYSNELEPFQCTQRIADQGELHDIIYLDFQKVFEEVSCKKLSEKLSTHELPSEVSHGSNTVERTENKDLGITSQFCQGKG